MNKIITLTLAVFLLLPCMAFAASLDMTGETQKAEVDGLSGSLGLEHEISGVEVTADVSYDKTEDIESTDNGELTFEYEITLNDKWSIPLVFSNGYDDVSDIDWESMTGIFVKYKPWNQPEGKVKGQFYVSTGPLYHHEKTDETEDVIRWSTRLKGSISKDIFSAKASVEGQPNVEHADEDYIIEASAEAAIEIFRTEKRTYSYVFGVGYENRSLGTEETTTYSGVRIGWN